VTRLTRDPRSARDETSGIEKADREAIPEDDGQRTLCCHLATYRIDNMMFRKKDGHQLLGHSGGLGTDRPLAILYATYAAVIMQWQIAAGTEGRALAGWNRASTWRAD